MTDPATTHALAAATTSLVVERDVAGTLAVIVGSARTALDGAVCGLLMADANGVLEVLSAASHQPRDLRLLESQALDGPCLQAWVSNAPVLVRDAADLARRWPELAGELTDADLGAALVTPVRWNEESLGALALFRSGPSAFSESEVAMARAFADLAMLSVVHAGSVSVRTAARRVDEALEGRVIIERAKGVLAYQQGIPLSEAYDALQKRAAADGRDLTGIALSVLEQAQGS